MKMASLGSLAMARCVEAIAEHDLGRAAATFGVCLHVLRKGLILISLAEDEALISPPISPSKIAETLKASHQLYYS